MDIEIRVPSDDNDIDALYRNVSIAFGETDSSTADTDKALLERDRTLMAVDSSHRTPSARVVGGICAYSFDFTTPGAMLPAAGVSWAGVLPTHRRRGILRSLIDRQLHDVHARGEPLAVLWASESSIYGRYGYGRAVPTLGWTIETTHSRFVSPPERAGAIALLEKKDAWAPMQDVYEDVRPRLPGFVSRTQGHWEHQFQLENPAAPPYIFAVHFGSRVDGGERADGYVAYQLHAPEWEDEPAGLPAGRLTVRELVASTPRAYAALWDYVFSTDLVQQVTATHRPVDEPLVHMLHDARRLQGIVTDAIWLRIVDTVPALEGRRYATSDTFTIEVIDDLCPWNDGRWQLLTDPVDPVCKQTGAAPDITVPASSLAAIYMGASTLTGLSFAGLADEHTPGALARIDAAFSHPVAPWAPHNF